MPKNKFTLSSAISAVNTKGALLVFAIKNQKDPESLWSYFFPKSKMKWEWDDGSDHRVADLWFLREKLSSSGKVVYSKWFRGRATLFSKEIFPALLNLVNAPERASRRDLRMGLSASAFELLRYLEDNSPLSTKELKEISGLQGKANEGDYSKRLQELWSRLLIVGSGEVDDGAFPSLAMSATRNFFEDEYALAREMDSEDALSKATQILGPSSAFYRHLIKLRGRRLTEVPQIQEDSRSIRSEISFSEVS